jgi:hypothetical protein
MSKLIPNPNGIIFNRTRQYIAYADAVLILGRSVRAIVGEVKQSKGSVVITG